MTGPPDVPPRRMLGNRDGGLGQCFSDASVPEGGRSSEGLRLEQVADLALAGRAAIDHRLAELDKF